MFEVGNVVIDYFGYFVLDLLFLSGYGYMIGKIVMCLCDFVVLDF